MIELLRLNNLESVNKYNKILDSISSREPYFQISYLNIFGGGLDNLCCFVFSCKNDGKILMLAHINLIQFDSIENNFFDSSSPYGYFGPIHTNNISEKDLSHFWMEVDSWYKKNNIITEFIRFDLFDNQNGYTGDIVQTMLNIKGKILDYELQWKNFDRKVKKNVNRAKKENLKSIIYFGNIQENEISEFHNIYTDTMIRNNANNKFLYSKPNIISYVTENKNYCAICTVYCESVPISSELVLISEDSIYSFLGGTDKNFFDKRPNDYLKYELINWARKNKFKYFVLGGGYGSQDGIFKYKKCFFPDDVVPYYTGRKVINKKIYKDLSHFFFNHRNKQFLSDQSDLNFFPIYRAIEKIEKE